MSTGAVVGGIGAGIVAIAAIGFAIAFFLVRRSVFHFIVIVAQFDCNSSSVVQGSVAITLIPMISGVLPSFWMTRLPTTTRFRVVSTLVLQR